MVYHHLPSEILLQIFKLSFATASPVSREVHTPILRQLQQRALPLYSLVHSTWRPIAQQLLWSDIVLWAEASGRNWLESDLTKKGRYRTAKVVFFHYLSPAARRGEEQLSEETGMKILSRCRGLRGLELGTESSWSGKLFWLDNLKGKFAVGSGRGGA